MVLQVDVDDSRSDFPKSERRKYPPPPRPAEGSLLACLLKAEKDKTPCDVDWTAGTLQAPFLRYEGPAKYRWNRFESYPLFGDAAIRKVAQETAARASSTLLGKLLKGRFCIDFAGRSIGFSPMEMPLRSSQVGAKSESSELSCTWMTSIDFLLELMGQDFSLWKISREYPIGFEREIPFSVVRDFSV